MKLAVKNQQTPQPILSRIEEIDKQIESVLFEKYELNYLDQIKINDLENQIKKIYLKYAPTNKKVKVAKLQSKIKDLLEEDELDIQAYSMLDYKLKQELKQIKKPVMMSTLDDARVESFEERIDDIYLQNEPKHKELIKIDKLSQEKDTLLSLI